ncbi:hypothetical protein BS17DRAFT_785221 [Gyrodon lividus]|nr:hypothetical protein BS17DRAFT_785221 [Gyrodon lividus]
MCTVKESSIQMLREVLPEELLSLCRVNTAGPSLNATVWYKVRSKASSPYIYAVSRQVSSASFFIVRVSNMLDGFVSSPDRSFAGLCSVLWLWNATLTQNAMQELHQATLFYEHGSEPCRPPATLLSLQKLRQRAISALTATQKGRSRIFSHEGVGMYTSAPNTCTPSSGMQEEWSLPSVFCDAA